MIHGLGAARSACPIQHRHFSDGKMEHPDSGNTRRSGVSAEEARTQPAYQQAKYVQRVVIMSFPATLLIGAVLAWGTHSVWVIKVWFVALGLHLAVYIAAEVRSVYVFGRHIRRQVRELVSTRRQQPPAPDPAATEHPPGSETRGENP